VALLLHGILRADTAPDDEPSRGLRDQPLLRVSSDGLTGVGTDWSPDNGSLGRADLLAHHGLIEQLHWRHQACLPARFPSWFESQAALLAVLNQRSAEFMQALEHVRGRAELAVTVVESAQAPSEGGVEAASPGRAYLRQRQRTLNMSEALAAELRQVLGNEIVEEKTAVGPRPGVLLSMSVLVNMGDANALAERLRTSLPQRQDVRILINGPWPPYTFAVVQAREA